MRRREFLALVGGTAIAWPRQAGAQRGRTPRIGILWHAGNEEEEAPFLGAFRQGLRDLGYIENQTIVLENRFAGEQYDRFDSLATELVKSKVDVIVASVPEAALAAKHATTTIPIVFALSGDPVGQKLVDSLAHPGGNVTGFSTMAVDLSAKQLELLKDTVVPLSRVALLYNPNDPYSSRMIENTKAAADSLQVMLHLLAVRAPNELEDAFSMITKDRAAAVIIAGDSMLVNERKRIAELALANRLPTIGVVGQMAQAGILITYGQDIPEFFRRTAVYVDKILKGAKPADLPVEQATRLKLVVNVTTAKALGLTLPQSILLRADEVIE